MHTKRQSTYAALRTTAPTAFGYADFRIDPKKWSENGSALLNGTTFDQTRNMIRLEPPSKKGITRLMLVRLFRLFLKRMGTQWFTRIMTWEFTMTDR